MNYLEKMMIEDEAISVSDKFLNFIRHGFKNSIKGKFVYVFYEGVDDRYFYDYYVNSTYVNYELIDFFKNGCGDKHSVNEMYTSIKEWSEDWTIYPKELFLFFCDRDYDTLIDTRYNVEKQQNGCPTTYYSIESYLAEKGVLYAMLNKLLIKGLNAPLLDGYYKKLDSDLMAVYTLFAAKNLKLTLCAMAQRKFEKTKDTGRKMRLKDVHIMTFFQIKVSNFEDYVKDPSQNLLSFSTQAKYSEIEDRPYKYLMTKGAQQIELQDYEFIFGLETKFKTIDIKEFIRGKWFSKLLSEIYKKIREGFKSIKLKNGTKPSVTDRLSLNATINVYSGVMHSEAKFFPEDLKQFLELNYNKIK